MRCLHCGNRISLLRKLKDSEFCSDEHREFYALQQQQMAVSRLMETSSPKHKQLPELIRHNDSERALPRGTDRRALNTAPAAPVAEPRPTPTPSPAPTPAPPTAAAAVPVMAPPAPVSTAPMPPVSKSPGGFVSQMPFQRDWAPRRRRAVEPEAGELMPVLAAPRLEQARQRRLIYGHMLEISGSHEWSRPGAFAALPYCEAPVAPALVSTLSEILSLSMNGFVCEQALVLDLTPVPAPKPVHVEPELEPAIEPATELVPRPALAQSAEAGLGASQLPQAQRGGLAISTVEDLPLAPVCPPQPAGLPRAPLGLRGQLPEIDWTVEKLDRVAARHEPGLVRLRTPRLRSPQLARLVKPAAGNSGPPIRVRPSVRPPEGAAYLTLGLLAMPTGAKVALQFDRLVQGNAARLDVSPEPLTPKIPARLTGCASVQLTPGMSLAVMVPLPLRGPSGPAVATGAALESLAASVLSLGIPRGPFVRGNDFDPPMGARLPLVFEVNPRQPGAPAASKPPCRPVISYRWTPVNPEYHAVPEADWELLPRSMAQLTLSNPFRDARGPIASSETEPMASFQIPSLDSVRMATAHSPAGSNRLSISARMVPVSLDKNKPKGGSPTPISRLEHIAPKPGHQLKKSTLKTQADWQRNKWASASVYGSALWRIAIGKFSGAIDQAPRGVRWGAGVVALALGAFALFPNNQLAAPGDTGWTIANKPGGPETAVATAPPPPRRVRVQAPPPRAVPAKVARPVRVQPAAAGGDGSSLTGVWDNFQKGLSERAAVAYTDDFRNGLAEWEGAGDWARSWSYDASGFVRTGGLALLAPGRELTDYRMEFLGQIERRSMGWVVRASDLRNYYALKLTIIGDGPVPEVALIRYPVVNGVAGAASQQVLPIDVRADTVYRVQTEVRGDYYAVTVQGKVVDSWTDARLKRGSIGLFSGKGELARVRWVGVWHQYDTLGRLCALLAPSGLPGRERGANQ